MTIQAPSRKHNTRPLRITWLIWVIVLGTLLAGCASSGVVEPLGKRPVNIVATTGILANFAREVAGEQGKVTQIVPDGADPHSYEPTLRAVRDVAYADIVFSNYMMLEQHSIIRLVDANMPATAVSVSVAEEAAKNGATILPLVEDRSLDTVWLGMSVKGTGAQYGATRSSTIDLTATKVIGPGDAASYLTTSFGEPEIAFASQDGFQENDGFAHDTATLPAAAHQHMSWAFTKPGIYRIYFQARLRVAENTPPVKLNKGVLVFAVGVDATELAKQEKRTLIKNGHADLSVDLDSGDIVLQRDVDAAKETADLNSVIIEVPPRTLTQVPGQKGFRFMGEPGKNVYVLPQAVLGKHVHGSIDPHLWHNVHNAAAYVRVIRDQLVALDPTNASVYRQNAARYLKELDGLDLEVAQIIASIPEKNRKLVTTSDAYGYLVSAYDMEVAGFVAPNPAIEPSVADRIKLAATLEDLEIKAVFLEPNLAAARSTLRTAAQDAGVKVCALYGDTLDQDAPTYIDMMRANAHSLLRCLG